MLRGFIFDLKRFAVHDGPGLRTTVFFKGCPLECAFCHNPEGQSFEAELFWRPERCIACGACLRVCPSGALGLHDNRIELDRAICQVCGRCAEVCPSEALEVVGRRVTVEELLKLVERDRVFYDQSGGGVTCSGGEPLSQAEFLQAFLRACKQSGIHCVIDTCGYAQPEVFTEVCKSADYLLYDLKLLSPTRHKELTGVDNRLIVENLKQAVKSGKEVLIRYPLLPSVNDDRESLRELGELVASLNPSPPVEILPYHKLGMEKYGRLGKSFPADWIQPPKEEEIQGAIRCLLALGVKVIFRGKSWEDSIHGNDGQGKKAS